MIQDFTPPDFLETSAFRPGDSQINDLDNVLITKDEAFYAFGQGKFFRNYQQSIGEKAEEWLNRADLKNTVSNGETSITTTSQAYVE